MDTSKFYSNSTRNIVLLERNRSQYSEIKIFRDGSQTVPASATYSLQKPGGDKAVDAQAATVAPAGTCSYTLSAGELPETLTLGEGYLEEWNISIGSDVYRFRRMAAVVLRRLYPVVSQEDLYAEYSQLSSLLPSNLTSYQTYIDSAWEKVLRKIRNHGSGFTYLVTSPESFFDVHLNGALSKIFYDFHSNLGAATSRYFDLAQEHQKMEAESWAEIKFIYDGAHDNNPDADKRVAGTPIIYLSSSGGRYGGWR